MAVPSDLVAAGPAGDLIERKRRLREAAEARRAEVARAATNAAARVAERARREVPMPTGAPVSAYWPIGDELDPRPLLLALETDGHPCALPVVSGRGRPLVFRRWTRATVLEDAPFGLSVPPASAEEVTPEVLLVPLLAFDAQGYRLGYGGGFYDRTLAALRRAGGPVLAVGLAYAGQEVDEVPHGPSDERLDWVVSEREARRIR